MKYNSMKMEPKGKIPANKPKIKGELYDFLSGMGRCNALTRQGKSKG